MSKNIKSHFTKAIEKHFPAAQRLVNAKSFLANEQVVIKGGCLKQDPKYDKYRVMDPETVPWKDFNGEIPDAFDWRNVSGINYLSWSKNQHIPQYCGSCWAQAATSVIADRVNIARNWTSITIGISPQAIINCDAGGDCNGGDSMGVFQYAQQAGVVEDSCQAYVAANPPQESCSPIQICETCIPPAPPTNKTLPDDCSAVPKYPAWKVSAFAGGVSGPDDMKKAIYTGGPISCSMDVTAKFEQYEGGVYSQYLLLPIANHEVSVVGWGETPVTNNEESIPYWIVRNSWGSFWGEWGFFRIKMGSDNLGIEKGCAWATPIVPAGSKSAAYWV
jgi:cathepsin X